MFAQGEKSSALDMPLRSGCEKHRNETAYQPRGPDGFTGDLETAPATSITYLGTA
jgi:hypothetical protein